MLNRRDLLQRTATGFGLVGLANLLNDQHLLAQTGPLRGSARQESPLAPRQPHFAPKAKRIIHVFMNGGPSQVDTFDPKPELTRHNGRAPGGPLANVRGGTRTLMASPYRFFKSGRSGLPVSEIFPKVGECADDLC